MARIPSTFKLSEGFQSVASMLANEGDLDDEEDDESIEEFDGIEMNAPVSRLMCKAAAMDCILSLEGSYPSEVWPAKMLLYICECFMKCGTEAEVDSMHVRVTGLVVSKTVSQSLLTTNWEELPVLPTKNTENSADRSTMDKSDSPRSAKEEAFVEIDESRHSPRVPTPKLSSPAPNPKEVSADVRNVTTEKARFKKRNNEKDSQPQSASGQPAPKPKLPDHIRDQLLSNDVATPAEKLANLLSEYPKIKRSTLGGIGDDELLDVYAHALSYYFEYDTGSRRLQPTSAAPHRNMTYEGLVKRVEQDRIGQFDFPQHGSDVNASTSTIAGQRAGHKKQGAEKAPQRASQRSPPRPSNEEVSKPDDGEEGMLCTVCNQVLPKDCFNKKQRKKKKQNRKCGSCLASEGVVGAAFSEDAAPTTATPQESSHAPASASSQMFDSMEACWCSACCKRVKRDNFSQNQQMREPRTRRCTSCIKANVKSTRLLPEEVDHDTMVTVEERVQSKPEPAPTELECSACALLLPLDEYSKSQKAKGDSRRCRTCVASTLPDVSSSKPKIEYDAFDHELAEELREQGNQYYRSQNFRAAEDSYCRAINTIPVNPIYWGNRSAARFMLELYSESLDDALKAIELDPQTAKYHARAGKNFVYLGCTTRAENAFAEAMRLDPKLRAGQEGLKLIETVHKKEATALDWLQTARPDDDFDDLAGRIEDFIDQHPTPGLRLLRELADIRSNPFQPEDRDDTIDEIHSIVDECDGDHDATLSFYAGLCFYYLGELETAMDMFDSALDTDPGLRKCQSAQDLAIAVDEAKNHGKRLYSWRDYAQALSFYEDALKIDPSNRVIAARLNYNCGLTLSNLGRKEEAIAACSRAIAIDCTYAKAWIKRGNLQLEAGHLEEAVNDIQMGHDHLIGDHDPAICELLRDAKMQLKKSKRVDYYKLLDISETATPQEIKKAYYKAAKLHHPDRHQTPEAKAKGDALFKKIGEAHEVLSDPQKRAKYDRGDFDDGSGGGHGSPYHDFTMDDLMGFFFATRFGGYGGGGFPFHGHGGEYDGYDDEYDDDHYGY